MTLKKNKPKVKGKQPPAAPKQNEFKLARTPTEKGKVISIGLNEKPQTYKVLMSPTAWAKSWRLVSNAEDLNTEVAWCTPILIDKENMVINIPDVFVPEQEVQGATADITSWGKVLFEAHEAGYDSVDMRGWFHLHPNGMSVNPSGTDESTTEDHLQQWNTLLRGIFNNKHDMKIDFFDKDAGLAYYDLKVEVDWTSLYDVKELDDSFKERVTKKVYRPVSTVTNPRSAQGSYPNLGIGGGSYQQSLNIPNEDTVYTKFFVKNMFSHNVYVLEEDMDIVGQDAGLVYIDGVEIGYSLAELISQGELTKEEFRDFLIRSGYDLKDKESIKLFFPILLEDNKVKSKAASVG